MRPALRPALLPALPPPMQPTRRLERSLAPTAAALTLLAAAPVHAAGWSLPPDNPNRVELEGLSIKALRNDVQIPNDAGGTRFALGDLTGTGPVSSGRLTWTRRIADRQELVGLYAPLSLGATGVSTTAIDFQGTRFAAGTATRADYKFDSWRLTWRYRVIDTPNWTLNVGATGKIRDARIALAQGPLSAEKSDIGFVPLLHLQSEWRLAERLTLVGDFDGLAGGPGRAIDAGLRLRWSMTPTWSLQAGWRVLDGGVDNTGQYNFARFQSLLIGVGARF